MSATNAWLRLMRLGNAPTAVSALAGAWALYGGEPLQVAGVGVAIVAAYIGGMLRLLPGRDGTDGFFMAVLQSRLR